MPNPVSRLWHITPEWVFRLIGAMFFLSYFALQIPAYVRDWPSIGYYYTLPSAAGPPRQVSLPFVRLLVDASFLTIAIGYCVRRPPRRRARGLNEVVIPMIAAFWPLLPFWAMSVTRQCLRWGFEPSWLADAGQVLAGLLTVSPGLTFTGYLIGSGLLLLGSTLDIWAYIALRHSLSIVAEARELVVSGPYRWIRHPVYLGQIISQAAIWLLFHARPIWIAYYLTFVALQLWRAHVEDRVLARTFGAEYARWRSRTPWIT